MEKKRTKKKEKEAKKNCARLHHTGLQVREAERKLGLVVISHTWKQKKRRRKD